MRWSGKYCCKGSASLSSCLGVERVKPPFFLELDVGILPLRNVAVGEEILLVKGLVQFLERLPGIDEAL